MYDRIRVLLYIDSDNNTAFIKDTTNLGLLVDLFLGLISFRYIFILLFANILLYLLIISTDIL
jgi:hypothetical protein